ncbi:MAG: YciI family protein [Casimicrobiaceae bacterium]
MASPRSAVRAARTYRTQAQRVFDAWLDPAIAGRFLFAMATQPMTHVAIDARIAGTFSFRRDAEFPDTQGARRSGGTHRRTRMHYMLMCCINEQAWEAMAPSARDNVMHDYESLIGELVKDGRYVSGGKLRSAATATTVRQKAGKPVVTDGPFAETKEQLGGYHVVECADIDEAIAVAQRIPTLRVGGTVEVRPLEKAST